MKGGCPEEAQKAGLHGLSRSYTKEERQGYIGLKRIKLGKGFSSGIKLKINAEIPNEL